MAASEEKDNQLNAFAVKLKDLMKKEISLMREILANMGEEQDVILLNKTALLKGFVNRRESIVNRATMVRQERVNVIKEIAVLEEKEIRADEYDIDLSELLDLTESNTCEVLTLREMLVTLMEKINTQNARNNYLLQNKITLTKELINSITPQEVNFTYGANGGAGKQVKTKTITLINHEV